jgi:hypothetical protein
LVEGKSSLRHVRFGGGIGLNGFVVADVFCWFISSLLV